jgi:hypothetical protein
MKRGKKGAPRRPIGLRDALQKLDT